MFEVLLKQNYLDDSGSFSEEMCQQDLDKFLGGSGNLEKIPAKLQAVQVGSPKQQLDNLCRGGICNMHDFHIKACVVLRYRGTV